MKRSRLLACSMLLALALPAGALADSSQLRLSDSLDGPDFAPGGGLYYKRNKEQGAGSATFEVTVEGRRAVELAVRPQCPGGDTLCSERAEVWERPEVLAGYDKPVWYAFSMRLDQPVPEIRHRYVMAQWKREIIPGAEGDYSPFLALRLLDGRLAVTIDTDTGRFEPIGTAERPKACLPGETPATQPDPYRQFRSLVAVEPSAAAIDDAGYVGCTADIRVTRRQGVLPAASSGWIDFVFLTKPGPKGDGRIEIAANGMWVATVEGRIGHEGPGLGENQYFKFGPYRAGRDDTWRIFYNNFRRGPSCTDVAAPELCATIAGAPVNRIVQQP
ncbi:heparin lyase I family protein [Ancylobacter terrae]|uniref:heparin lyase I family protein n=1 Tax=Ancylobacter sp. sgz301288 TaxID=3342077 RepID=UPI00385A9A06